MARRQNDDKPFIILTNDHLVHGHIYASIGFDELTNCDIEISINDLNRKNECFQVFPFYNKYQIALFGKHVYLTHAATVSNHCNCAKVRNNLNSLFQVHEITDASF